MPTQFEQQVIANTLAINEIVESSENYNQFNILPGGIQETDIISILRLDEEGEVVDTFKLPAINFAGVQPKFKFINFGLVTSQTDNTTSQEIEDRINSVGFDIERGDIALLICYILIDGDLHKASYYYLPNEVGFYGDGFLEIGFEQLYLFEITKLNITTETFNLQVIELGDIGSNTIVEYINSTTQQPEWDLIEGNLYAFKCIINGSRFVYLYKGVLPRHLGQEDQNLVVENDFLLIENQGWYWAENCWVEKVGNLNYTLIEEGDIVFYKRAARNGESYFLVGWRYNGGDKNEMESYTKVRNIA